MKKLFAIAILLALPVLALAGEGHRKPTAPDRTQSSQSIATSYAAGGSQHSSQILNVAPNAPDAIAPSIYPTAPCVVGASGSGSWLTGGFGFGFGLKDRQCQKIEAAKAFQEIGQYTAALHILCTTRSARRAHLKACRRFRRKKRK